MKIRSLLIFNFMLLLTIVKAQTYEQLGGDLNGTSADNFGNIVASSADGTIIAASGPKLSLRGEVKIYEFTSGSWTEKGSTLQGEVDGDNFGKGLSMSADGSILAIGAPFHQASFGEFSNSGRVYVYEWNGSVYAQIFTLDASASGESFGDAISISSDGNVLAVAAPFAAGGGSNRGAVRVYRRSGNDYLKIGSDLNGVQDNELFGNSVDIAVTATDTVLVVGAPSFSSVPGNFDDSGQARIFNYNATSWSSADTFTGDLGALFGNDVSLSDDGSRLAVGTMVSLFSPINTYFEVYEFTTSWQLLGSRVTTGTLNDEFGRSVAIAGNGSRLIVGAPGFVDPDSPNGYVNIYEFATSDWNLLDSIAGVASGDIFGTSVATTTTGEQFVVGAALNGAGGENAGQVKVYGPPIPDTEAPTVSFATTEPEFETNAPLLATVTFSEEVTGFESTDITVDNGTVTNFSTSDNTVFDIEITPTTDGVINVSVAAGVANDLAGNANEASESNLILKYDVTAPIIALSDTLFNSTTPTLFGSINDAFPKSVSLRIDGGSTVYQTGIIDTVWFTNSFGGDTFTEGMHTIEVTALDSADNQTVIDSIFYIDSTNPTVAITAPDSVGNTNSFDASISFSEVVSGVDIADFSVNNAAITALSTEDSISFTATITPDSDGEVTIELEQNKVLDWAGNFNTASNEQITQFDNTPPELFLENVPIYTNSEDFTVDFVVSEDLKAAIPISDINVVNANFKELVSLPSETAVKLVFTPTGDGSISLNFPANIAEDKFGNINEASEVYVIKYDNTTPIVSINEQTITEAGPITLDGSIEEANLDSLIIGVGATNYVIPQENIENGAWSLTLENLSEGIYDLSARAVDSARNEASVNITEGLMYNASAPTVTIENLPAEIGFDPVELTFSFSEPISGFDVSDVEVDNASISGFVMVDEQTATASITADEELEKGTTITITIEADAFVDLAGRFNETATSASAIFNFKYSGGSGTEDDPYLIANEDDLRQISYFASISEDLSSHFLQISDIQMGSEAFTPIGFSESAIPKGFDGIYEGDNHFISGMKIGNCDAYCAMFYELKQNAEISNLSLLEVEFLSGGRINAALAASASSSEVTNEFDFTISNVHVSGPDVLFEDGLQNGGIVGFVSGDLLIEDCTNDLSISATQNSPTGSQVTVGGLVGYQLGVILIRRSANYGSLNGELVGGLIGLAAGTENRTSVIESSFNSGTLHSSKFAGGVVGKMDRYTTNLTNSYNIGNVSSDDYHGGLIGEVDNSVNNVALITNCYSNGKVGANGGGLLGWARFQAIQFRSTFWDTELSGTETNIIGGNGLITSEMRKRESYVNEGWDLDNIWSHAGVGFHPVLKWQFDNATPFTIAGKAINKEGEPFTNGTVKANFNFLGTIITRASAELTNEGTFSLDIPLGIHSIIIEPNEAEQGYAKTYYGDANRSTLSRHVLSSVSDIEIQMIEKSDPNQLTGNGIVNGRVVDAGTGTGRIVQGAILDGEGLEGVTVFLVRTSDEEILTQVETDANGDFEITGIPAGEYQLLLDVVGIDVNLEGSTFTMDEEGTPLVISAAVSEDGVVFNIEEEVLGIKNEIAVNVFPNPVRDFINIEIPGQASLRVIDINGVVIKVATFTDITRLNVSELKSDMYFLEITNTKGRAVKKLVKQ